MTTTADQQERVRAAIEAFKNLPFEEQEKVLRAQAESWGRSCVSRPGDRQAVAVKPNWVGRCAWIADRLIDKIAERCRDPELAPERADPDDPRQSLELPHLLWMALELRDRKLDSETKVCRWLGWLQAGLVGLGFLTLEQMKQLNLASGDPSNHGRGPLPGTSEPEAALVTGS